MRLKLMRSWKMARSRTCEKAGSDIECILHRHFHDFIPSWGILEVIPRHCRRPTPLQICGKLHRPWNIVLHDLFQGFCSPPCSTATHPQYFLLQDIDHLDSDWDKSRGGIKARSSSVVGINHGWYLLIGSIEKNRLRSWAKPRGFQSISPPITWDSTQGARSFKKLLSRRPVLRFPTWHSLSIEPWRHSRQTASLCQAHCTTCGDKETPRPQS